MEGKGKRMRCLEELEEKVLRLIQKNQDLQAQCDVTVKEVAQLREQSKQYEASLMREAHASQTLSQEKAALVNSIEELLNSINALDSKVK